MITTIRPSLADLEQGICDLASKHLCIPREEVHPSSRIIEDLHADSLDVVEWTMAIEETYGVTLPFDSRDPASKTVFTRSPLRLKDVAEAVYLQWGTGSPDHSGRSRRSKPPVVESPLPFTQLNGRWTDEDRRSRPLFEPIGTSDGVTWFRRASDGMRCALLPAGVAVLGSEGPEAGADERPLHRVELESFLIDAEPVSTTAYCRFLNSAGGLSDDVLRRWVLLAPEDDRQAHMVIERDQGEWRPVAGTECAPMVLVSWFGAQAYALWAGGADWRAFDSTQENSLCGLPSEAQWEHAAAGPSDNSVDSAALDTSGDLLPDAQAALHEPGQTYTAATMPLTAVHLPLGRSRFGLHHMAGNVWQWCRDWYAADFYGRPDSGLPNPVNRVASGVRSERGGSWVGPTELCRRTYRRGRAPDVRGRCLGFRCVSATALMRR